MDALTWARLIGLVLLLAVGPLAWIWVRRPQASRAQRLAALAGLVVFLTFDLIVFGAFTRLSDSGLGCPDWPGCYGEVSPLAARDDIAQAETAQPTGPVTLRKAWIEMLHRYLAATVGALILVMWVLSWGQRRAQGLSMWWPSLAMVWVLIQGLFGKYTVLWKLQPFIVSAHLLGGLLLLALLVVQYQQLQAKRIQLPPSLRAIVPLVWTLVLMQAALGAWVSTNYAVLACRGFPDCNGQWWPQGMDFEHGFAVWRDLGRTADGRFLPAEALVAIHWTHRLGALITALALMALAWQLQRQQATAFARLLAGLLGLQVLTGVANVVLHWPLLAALLHTAGAAGLLACLTALWAQSRLPPSRLGTS